MDGNLKANGWQKGSKAMMEKGKRTEIEHYF